MTKNEALMILGLNESATEEEIKHAYWRLCGKYHPDVFIGSDSEKQAAEEKIRKINEAKDTLERFRKGSFKKQNVLNYKEKLIDKLKKLMGIKNIPNEFKNYYEEISSIIDRHLTIIRMLFLKLQIDMEYDNCLIDVKNVYITMKDDYFDTQGINENSITEKINYDCNFEDFCDQLLQLNKKYNLKDKYRKRIEQDLNDYKLRVGYAFLKDLINVAIDNILKRLKINNYTNYEEELNNGKKKIDEVYAMYFKFLSQFKDITDFLDGRRVDDPEITKISSLYKKAWKDFNNHVALIDTERSLKTILSLIDDYKKHEEFLNSLKLIDEFTKTIVNNYHSVLSKLTYPNDLEKATQATKVLNEVFEIIKCVKSGFISMEGFKNLINLTFTNYEEDINILNLVKGMNSSRNIYVRQRNIRASSDISLGRVIKEDEDNVTIYGKYELDYYTKGRKNTIKRVEFNRTYMPLKTFLSKATFCGYQRWLFSDEILLYYTDLFALIYDISSNSIDFKSYKKGDISNKFCSESLVFKDINYTIDFIDNELRQLENEFEKEEIKRKL